MNIAIIEDQITDIDVISGHFSVYFSNNHINMPLLIQTFESGEVFLCTFTPHSYDILFIDYYLTHMSGLDTAFAVRKTDPAIPIVFTTASRDYAVDSYRVNASGYLVKPITYEAFTETLTRIDMKKLKEHYCMQLTIGREIVSIPLRDIIYCDIAGHYVQIHCLTMDTQRSRMTFNEISCQLKDYPQFLTCYRGCIINMDHIRYMKDLVFVMDNGERIPFRKKNCNEIIQAYTDFIFQKVREG